MPPYVDAKAHRVLKRGQTAPGLPEREAQRLISTKITINWEE